MYNLYKCTHRHAGLSFSFSYRVGVNVSKTPHCPLVDIYLFRANLHQPVSTRVTRAYTLYPYCAQGDTYAHGTQLLLDAAIDTLQNIRSGEEFALLTLHRVR